MKLSFDGVGNEEKNKLAENFVQIFLDLKIDSWAVCDITLTSLSWFPPVQLSD